MFIQTLVQYSTKEMTLKGVKQMHVLSILRLTELFDTLPNNILLAVYDLKLRMVLCQHDVADFTIENGKEGKCETCETENKPLNVCKNCSKLLCLHCTNIMKCHRPHLSTIKQNFLFN